MTERQVTTETTNRHERLTGAALAALLFVLGSLSATAQPAGSAHFRAETQEFSSGMATSSSSTFALRSCLEFNPAGAASSASFRALAGCGALLSIGLPSDDDDGDGLSNGGEDAAPNGGDGNGDGIPDRVQSNVASFQTPDGLVTLVTSPGTCGPLHAVQSLPASTFGTDSPFRYPAGLLSFTIPCVPAGGLATVTAIFHGWPPGAWPPPAYRAFGVSGTTATGPGSFAAVRAGSAFSGALPSGAGSFYDVTGVTFGTTSIPGEGLVPTAMFTISDGGPGDETPQDGTIFSQSGPAEYDPAAIGVPALSGPGLALLAAALAAAALLALRRLPFSS